MHVYTRCRLEDLCIFCYFIFFSIHIFKELSIESDNGVIGMGLWRVLGIRDNLLGYSLSQNRRWDDIQWIFASARSPITFAHCICLGSNPRLVETGRWGVYQGDIVLSPYASLFVINEIKTKQWNTKLHIYSLLQYFAKH